MLGINFTPEPSGIAPYTTRMAYGLSDRGHRVRVVTSYPHYPEWRVARDYRGWRMREQSNDTEVTRVRHYVPSQPTSGRRVLSEMSFGSRLLGERPVRADVVLCASPALISTAMVAATAAGRRSRAAFGVVVQDLYSAGLRESAGAGGRVEALMTRLESWTLRRADGVAVIHDRFRDQVVGTLGVDGDRVDVIRNWTHIPTVDGSFDRVATRAALGWGDELVVLHTGAMGDKQGLSNVVDAARLAQATGAPMRFVLLGDGKQRADLERHAIGCRAITIANALPEADFVRALRSADLLLVNEKPGVAEMAVPSKLTSYFSAGVAVLAATEPTSTTAEELQASGAGLRIDPGDPGALVSAALRLRDDHRARLDMGSRGLDYCARLLSEERALDAYDAWVRKLYARKHGE